MISYTKCQKTFNEPEIAVIQALTKQYYDNGRCRISREVCKELEWYGENGKPKEWVCRELLVQMSRDGVIKLPAPMPKAANRFLKKQAIDFLEPAVPFTGRLEDQGEVTSGEPKRAGSRIVARLSCLSIPLIRHPSV